jgi:inorganic pyrophosphatase/exopolyphosphatase
MQQAFFLPSIEKKYFIIGSTACDMDSVLSAWMLSIFENMKVQTLISDESTEYYYLNPEATIIYYPILNCNRGDLKLRLDVKYVFEKFGLKEEEFFYINDPQLNEKTVSHSKNLGIVLVDHSELAEKDSYFKNLVEDIYDHHVAYNFSFPNCHKRFIKFPVGSCTTLILCDFILDIFPLTIIPPILAVTAILLDTMNFNPNIQRTKWCDLDESIYENIMALNKEPIDVEKYYKEILDAKMNFEKNIELGYENLLRKDRKHFMWGKNKVVWSSLPISIHDVIEKFGLENIMAYIKKTWPDVDFYLVHSMIEDENKLIKIFINFFKNKVYIK